MGTSRTGTETLGGRGVVIDIRNRKATGEERRREGLLPLAGLPQYEVLCVCTLTACVVTTELLRKSAEHTLMDMVQVLFSRLPEFKEDSKWFVNMKKVHVQFDS